MHTKKDFIYEQCKKCPNYGDCKSVAENETNINVRCINWPNLCERYRRKEN